ncbi:MAG: ketoacyl-ACP synthase III [Actinomycetota bacterium]|nr:ketoacyl-ACP synthase III [Actinomycetota bacterium]
MGAAITGWGTALPSGSLGNAELAARLDISEDWIFQRTGIRARGIVAADETTSSLATQACRAALERAEVLPETIDLVIVATATPDYQLPATASIVQARVGCNNAGAFDLNAACSGFLYALAQANALVESGTCRRVLVCGAEALSKIVDYSDARSCVLFGDGAAAVVVEGTSSGGNLGPFVLRSDGSEPELLHVLPEERLIRMDGREVYRRAVEGMTDVLTEVLTRAGIGLDDVDHVVAHQANARIVEAVAERLGMDHGKLVMNIENVGNTSAASIPLALAGAADQGRLAAGDTVALAAFGAGFAWGAGLLTWAPARRSPQTKRRLPELVGTMSHLLESI